MDKVKHTYTTIETESYIKPFCVLSTSIKLSRLKQSTNKNKSHTTASHSNQYTVIFKKN